MHQQVAYLRLLHYRLPQGLAQQWRLAREQLLGIYDLLLEDGIIALDLRLDRLPHFVNCI